MGAHRAAWSAGNPCVRERARERDTPAGREADREADREREKDREPHTERERQTTGTDGHGRTDRQTGRQTDGSPAHGPPSTTTPSRPLSLSLSLCASRSLSVSLSPSLARSGSLWLSPEPGRLWRRHGKHPLSRSKLLRATVHCNTMTI